MAEIYRFGNQVRDFLRGLLQVSEIPPSGGEEPSPEQFPSAGIDIVYHTLRVGVDIGAKGKDDEIINLYGKMLVQRGDPYVNEQGYRQIDFMVMSWVASGWSWVLRQNVAYVLSEDTEQPPSSITAEQVERDFPATFSFNVIFDVRANNTVVFRKQHGRPEGSRFLVVPPDGNRKNSPTIMKFEDTLIALEHPNLGQIQFKPIDCNDQNSITIITF